MFRVPTHVAFGTGSLDRLPDVVRKLDVSRVVLVHGAGIGTTGWPERVMALLREADAEVQVYDTVECNPRDTTVDRIADLARAKNCEAVIGVGGGSTLDAAKAAAMLATNPGLCRDFEGPERYDNLPLPFIAVPTTCGSGSEVTWVSVINRLDERRKISVKGEAMFPSMALVDPDLLTTLPRSLIASTGADALTHAIEAYACRASNPLSDALAEKSVALLFEYLERAVTDISGDHPAREQVMRASLLAGMAFGNADVASVHCLSESIGGVLPEAPHGVANAVLLTAVLRFQIEAVVDRLEGLGATMQPARSEATGVGSERGAEGFVTALDMLFDSIGIPQFEALGLAEHEFPLVAELAQTNGSNASSPRPMTARDYREILETVAST